MGLANSVDVRHIFRNSCAKEPKPYIRHISTELANPSSKSRRHILISGSILFQKNRVRTVVRRTGELHTPHTPHTPGMYSSVNHMYATQEFTGPMPLMPGFKIHASEQKHYLGRCLLVSTREMMRKTDVRALLLHDDMSDAQAEVLCGRLHFETVRKGRAAKIAEAEMVHRLAMQKKGVLFEHGVADLSCAGCGVVEGSAQAREGAEFQKFLTCAKCRARFYCSKACQVADWKAKHKSECVQG